MGDSQAEQAGDKGVGLERSRGRRVCREQAGAVLPGGGALVELEGSVADASGSKTGVWQMRAPPLRGAWRGDSPVDSVGSARCLKM